MSVENQNRKCGCGNNMVTNNIIDNSQNNSTIAALNNNWMMNDSCDNFDMCTNSCDCENATREELLHHIKCYAFAIQELALYLDTHPDDEKALCLHNKYCKEYKELTDKYQKVYGPLTINYPCNKWRWLEEPWPWEGGMN
jgi:spore coat protein JB